MAILDDAKVVLRISATNTSYNTEINDLISAAIADLKLSGLTAQSAVDTNTLVKRAILTYVKANYGFDNPDSEKLMQAYDMLKSHLSMSYEYGYYTVTVTVTDAETDEAIREATVTFNGESQTTNENGVAYFYVRKGYNYIYTVQHEDYEDYEEAEGEDNLLDVTANTELDIALTGRD